MLALSIAALIFNHRDELRPYVRSVDSRSKASAPKLLAIDDAGIIAVRAVPSLDGKLAI
jgi:hypothetical protein